MKTLSKFLVFSLFLWGTNNTLAQTSLKQDEAGKVKEVKHLVKSGRYTFEASKMIMKKGSNETVRHGDDLDISKDTLIVYLPDLGKSPLTPVRARAAGVTCTHFDYHMMPAHNGSYNVTIRPEQKNVKDISRINMHISKEGYATVTVTTAGHNHLKYYGYIKQHSALFPPVTAMR